MFLNKPKIKAILYAAVFILAAIFLLSKISSMRVGVPGDWFGDIKGPISLTTPEEEAIVRFAASSILRKKSAQETLPVSLSSDTLPRIVFLSVSNGKRPAHVVMASGKGIVKAIGRALSKVHMLSEKGYRPEWVKLDIVQDVRSMRNVDINKPLDLERSLEGVAFDECSDAAFLPEELVAYTLIDSKRKVRPRNMIRYLTRRTAGTGRLKKTLQSGDILMYRFVTISYFSDGEKIVPLYRGHRIFRKISGEELLSTARSAGRYLIQALNPDGKFDYKYLPKTDNVPEKYNILRHAGTIYAMLELYEVTGDQELLRAAQKAIGYLLRSVKPCPTGKEKMSCVVEDGYVKLGGNALAVIALSKYTELTTDKQYMPVVLELGRWIRSVQDRSGEFLVHKQSYPDGAVASFISQYYPGEALLALLRIYALDPDKNWLGAAEKGAQYLINVRDQGLSISELSHDHWLLYALNELYRFRRKSTYLDHALRIALAIVQSQNRNPVYPDWLGSYYRPPRSTSTAIRTEGLCAAYRLARDAGRTKEAEEILKAIRLGISFQLQTQFRPESVLYVKKPKRCIGGFHRSLTDFEIRIDYVQHNISALLNFYRIMREKHGE